MSKLEASREILNRQSFRYKSYKCKFQKYWACALGESKEMPLATSLKTPWLSHIISGTFITHLGSIWLVTSVFIWDYMFNSKIVLQISSTRTWSPINWYNLPPQKNSTRRVHFVVSANVYRDKRQWCLYPNTSERMAVQPQGEAFSTPRYTASATSSISLTLHDAGTWEQCHFQQNCVVCLHDVEEKHCTGVRGLTPPLTSCVTSSKAVRAPSPHPLNEGIGLDGFLIPFQFLQ